MFKRFATTFVILAAAASYALAAPAKGTVTSINNKTILVKVEGEKAPWIKKGATVKINKKINGKIAEVTDATVTITSSKAGELKVGEAITFDKSLAASGC